MLDERLLQECEKRSIQLLKNNLTDDGLIAASENQASKAKSYHCVFARDAAISAMGMILSKDPMLIEGAYRSLLLLAEHQAENGQIAKFVDLDSKRGDFWYLGCIDATLWWLIAVDFFKHTNKNLRDKFAKEIEKALLWLQCQEHPRLYLLQQNEASDWADIMPRSGFVLYTNALWYEVKKLYLLRHKEETKFHFNHLFHPFASDLPEYRRIQLLMNYVKKEITHSDLYLSFVNFSFFGKEGDVFGNILAVLFDLPSLSMQNKMIQHLMEVDVAKDIPIRVTIDPIKKTDPLWRTYMERHEQNFEYQYHNGGIWPFIGCFWVIALAKLGFKIEAERALEKIAKCYQENKWKFTEWFRGDTLEPRGMEGQSWNAAMFLFAYKSLKM